MTVDEFRQRIQELPDCRVHPDEWHFPLISIRVYILPKSLKTLRLWKATKSIGFWTYEKSTSRPTAIVDPQAFEECIQIIEEACQQLYDQLQCKSGIEGLVAI